MFEQGSYEVDIDGVSIGQFDGSSKSVERLALLAKAEGLTWGEHTVRSTRIRLFTLYDE